MTYKTKKTITFAILAALTIGVGTAPTALAGDGTVEAYYWQADPATCYNTGSLDNMTVDGSTGNGADVETELEVTVGTYNAEMNQITIIGNTWWNCNFSTHFDVASEDMADSNDLASEYSHFTSTAMSQSEIRFNTDQNWGTSTNSCNSSSNLDIEWVMNHEFGHGIGLKHHVHSTPNSVMHDECDSIIANLQTVDDTAIDIHYN